MVAATEAPAPSSGHVITIIIWIPSWSKLPDHARRQLVLPGAPWHLPGTVDAAAALPQGGLPRYAQSPFERKRICIWTRFICIRVSTLIFTFISTFMLIFIFIFISISISIFIFIFICICIYPSININNIHKSVTFSLATFDWQSGFVVAQLKTLRSVLSPACAAAMADALIAHERWLFLRPEKMFFSQGVVRKPSDRWLKYSFENWNFWV